ncbi:MAG: Hpt domain-containing protein [Butyrivibrio sp.]|nr:Hpt domain-containing protein [Butyrivibrio sp.]
MDESKKARLSQVVNFETAMDRFVGNEELLLSFLQRLSEDSSFDMYEAAMKEKRYDDAFKAAHTLKGLCGNLSLDGLFEVVSKEVELLRGGMYSEAEELLPEVERKYQETVEILAVI